MDRNEPGAAVRPNVWTVERVKEQLPDVQVMVGRRKVYRGTVRGRQLQFAGVQLYDEDNNMIGGPIEYAWETIVRALNNGTPLRS